MTLLANGIGREQEKDGKQGVKQSKRVVHQELLRRGLQVAQRSVTDQLYRYEELLAVSLEDRKRLKERLKGQKHVILALDGLQPDVG